MQVIASWTGGQADALRQALRMTNESFAEHLGVALDRPEHRVDDRHQLPRRLRKD